MSIRTYSSIDDMIADIQADGKAADARVEQWQTELADGDCFMRIVDAWGETVTIYCEIVPLEYEEDRLLHADPHMKNYRFCRCFSRMCPDGELGDVHISTISAKLSRKAFEEAQAAGWPDLV